MPSVAGRIMKGQIKLLKPILKRLDIKAQRKLQDALGELKAKVIGDQIHYENEFFADFDASWAIPENYLHDSVILYLHGGGYTAGSIDYAKGFGGVLAKNASLKTLCISYRLAPEYEYPCALDDALAAYKRILKKYSADKIALVGESAGGGLCYALALKLRDTGIPLPACISAISPWTDLTMSSPSYITNKEDDPVLFKDDLEYFAQVYAGQNKSDIYVSPLLANLKGLPPSQIHVGSQEILLDDSVKMADKLNDAGSPCAVTIKDGMWHVYVLYGIPEAKEALQDIVDFLHHHLLEKR